MRVAAAAISLALLGLVPTSAAFAAAQDCHIGSYRLSDGSAVDIAASDDDTLRWRAFTGETGQLHPNTDGTWASTFGWTGRPDGKTVSFSDCAKGDIAFDKASGHRIAFDVSDTTFDSHGTKLAGDAAG
jgi:streptogramin lyase